jgi:hypothetical protein
MLGVKQPGHETDTLLHLVPWIKLFGAISPFPYTSSWHGALLNAGTSNTVNIF